MASAEQGGASAFAAELRAQRAAQGWTQVELGKLIGYSGSFVSDVERGERSPSDDFAHRCDETFKLPGTFARLYEDLRRNAYPPVLRPPSSLMSARLTKSTSGASEAYRACCRRTSTRGRSSVPGALETTRNQCSAPLMPA